MAAIKDDLDYIRDLAEAGARAPLLGGRYLLWWGTLVTLGYLGHYLLAKGAFGLDISYVNYLWLGFMVLGLGGFFTLLLLAPKDKPGQGSAGNRAESVIWMFGGLSIFAFFIGGAFGGLVLKTGTAISPDASLPLVFAVYALALATTGALADNGVLKVAGWVALAFVAITSALQGRAELYLAASVAAALTVAIPGAMLMRAEPRRLV